MASELGLAVRETAIEREIEGHNACDTDSNK